MLTSLEKLEADEVVTEPAKNLARVRARRAEAARSQPSSRVPRRLSPVASARSPRTAAASTRASRGVARCTCRLLAWRLVREEAVRPARPRPAAREARRRALARDLRPRGRATRSRATRGGRVGVHEAASTRAGRWSVDGLLGTIEGLRMDSVAAESVSDAKELTRYGLAKPARTVTLVTKDGASRTLELGAAAPDPTATPAPTPSPSLARKKAEKKGEKPAPPKPTSTTRARRAAVWSRSCRRRSPTTSPRAWASCAPSACSRSRPTRPTASR